MAKTDYRSVDEYLAAQPPATRAVLQQVRDTVRAAIPDAVEAISYQMPAFEVDGAVALYLAGWKEHFSLYPLGAPLFTALGDEVAQSSASFPFDRS